MELEDSFNPGHALLTCLWKIRFNIVLLPTPKSCKSSLSFMFDHKNPICISSFLHIHTTCSTYHILLDLINWIAFGEEYKLWRSSLCHCLHSVVPYIQTSSSATYSITSSTYVFPSMSRSSFIPRQKNKQNYRTTHFNVYIIMHWITEKTRYMWERENSAQHYARWLKQNSQKLCSDGVIRNREPVSHLVLCQNAIHKITKR
jgi:hypothetical protein